MRVLHVIHALRPEMGGLPRAALSLAAAQAAQGADVALASFETERMDAGFPPAYADIPGLQRVPWLRLSAKDPMGLLSARRAAALFQRFEPGLIHTHGLWEPVLRHAHRWALRAEVPFVLCPHSMLNPWQNQHRIFSKFMLTRVFDWERLWRRALFVHALSGAEAERLRARGLERVRVFPNGVFTETGNSRDEPATESILFLGRLDRVKRPDLLLEAFLKLAERRPGVRLVFAGPDYGLQSRLMRRVQEAGLADRVRFPGMLVGGAKREAFREATCFCLPSESEGCSLSVLEAAAAGLLLLLSKACDLGAWFEAGAAAIAPEDAGALAQKLEELLDSPSLRQALGRAAGEKARRDHAWPVIAANMLEAYATP